MSPLWSCRCYYPGPLFINQSDVLPLNLVKSRCREIGIYDDRIVLKLVRHLGSAAADLPVEFQSDWKSLNPNLAASSLNEILRYEVCLFRGPGTIPCGQVSATYLKFG